MFLFRQGKNPPELVRVQLALGNYLDAVTLDGGLSLIENFKWVTMDFGDACEPVTAQPYLKPASKNTSQRVFFFFSVCLILLCDMRLQSPIGRV